MHHCTPQWPAYTFLALAFILEQGALWRLPAVRKGVPALFFCSLSRSFGPARSLSDYRSRWRHCLFSTPAAASLTRASTLARSLSYTLAVQAAQFANTLKRLLLSPDSCRATRKRIGGSEPPPPPALRIKYYSHCSSALFVPGDLFSCIKHNAARLLGCKRRPGLQLPRE